MQVRNYKSEIVQIRDLHTPRSGRHIDVIKGNLAKYRVSQASEIGLPTLPEPGRATNTTGVAMPVAHQTGCNRIRENMAAPQTRYVTIDALNV